MKKKTILTALAAAAIAVGAQAQALWLEPGAPVTLQSETPATGTGTISYQWFRDGNQIAGATSATLQITAAQARGVNVEFRRGATSPSCNGYNFSNTITITFCSALAIGNVCWAATNVAQPGMFAPIPDMFTEFYQWNKATAYSVTNPLSPAWSSTANTAASWDNDGAPPCPAGWRIPTRLECVDLHNSGRTWSPANSSRATVAGMFYGPRHAECSLPYDMSDCIFLPAGGWRNSSGTLNSQGVSSSIWTNSQYSTNYGYYFYFISGTSDPNGHENGQKTCGYTIRCVQGAGN